MRRTLRPAVALVTVAVLAACSNGGDPDPSPAETQSAQDTAVVDDTLDELRAGAGEDAETVPLEKELPVLATRSTTAGRTPLEVDLNSVRVTGELMTVVFTVRNLGDSNWQITEYFDDGSGYAPLDADGTRGDQHSTDLAFSTDGVTVLDPVNGRVHRAAYDTAGNCVCNTGLSSRFVGAGEAVVLTTAFAAPPEEVTEVTVQIPGAGSFDGVALNR